MTTAADTLPGPAPAPAPGRTALREPQASPAATPWRSVGTVAGAATVHGVHGAAGRTRWKCFAGRRQLDSPTEAVEWASVPPGGLSGEHRHTRTEEIYLVLRGRGEFLFNGLPHPVGPGTLALTAPGNVHGLRNTGERDLDWWVIETLAPGTDAVLSGADHIHPGVPPMGDAVIHDLFKERTVSTGEVFTGPLRQVEVVELDAGQRTRLGAPDAELAVFVHEGTGRATADGGTAPLAPDTCLTLGAATSTGIEAVTPLRLLIVTLALPRPVAEAS
ncbi:MULTISPECIES: cupin domain-containing protein [unclassified Streptomyces]|uniref:cupin domain-containing protein n=1 Tax=unclassified Streptomyces TaxID=2593676 RepID=UPI001F03DCE7|nr:MULTISPECIES: cupin domain-containing protein [unclassified Streptomyces]MCH0566239.1 cupin domain-containing protein [Streptomyces sp. MUM 2J]MCH0568406.1 cupin domain-containing protein [Streptomyces sp. MUM 136J]